MDSLDALATIFPTVLVVDEEGVRQLVDQRPRPYLPATRVQELMEILGFEFRDDVPLPVDTPEGRLKFSALMEIIAGAIAEWADVEPEDEQTWGGLANELQDWAQEYLVG
jgi:hypothetical protein